MQAQVGAGISAFLVMAALWHHRRRAARRARPPVPEEVGEEWFTAKTLAGFPMEAVRPLLLRPGAPNLARLYVAWVLATHGHEAGWIECHLGLPEQVVHILVDAARQRD